MEPIIQVSEPHQVSGRRALVEDDGDSVWLYLLAPYSQSIDADCWLCNRRAIAAAELDAWPRDRPPPATAEVMTSGATSDASIHDMKFRWDDGGNAVSVSLPTGPLGYIAPGDRRGHGARLRVSSDWGSPFDAQQHTRLFGE